MADTFEALLLALTAQLGTPVVTIPISTNSSGTPTVAGTGAEIFDSVLGFYQCSLIAGRRYLAVMNGVGLSGSVTGDLYRIQIRNSGTSSNPTTASTSVASTQLYIPTTGGGGQISGPLAGSFLAPATGTNTLGMSTMRLAGTGAGTPVFQRELYVMYLGVV